MEVLCFVSELAFVCQLMYYHTLVYTRGSAVYDLRSETVQEVSSTSVYLSTIGDGQNTFVSGSNRLRRCRLTASGPGHVSVEALELYFQDGVELNITDNCREDGGWVHGRNGDLFVNKHLHSIECSSADITFHDHGNNPHLAWLRFTATSPLNLTCNVTDLAPTSPSTEVKATAVAGAGETPDKDENPPTDDHNPVPTVIGVSVAVIALSIVLVLAIALVRRRRAHAVQKSEENTNRRDNNNERNTLEQEALLPPSAQARPNTAPLCAAERGEGEGDARSGGRRPGPGDTGEDALVYNILYESSRGKDAEQAGREEVASQRSALDAARQEELHYAVSGASPGYGIVRRREAGETADDVMGGGVSHEAPQAAAVTPRALARDEGSLAARDQPRDRAGGQRDFLVDNVLYESSQPKTIANGGREEARQQDSTEDQPSTDIIQQDSTEDQPSTDTRQQDSTDTRQQPSTDTRQH